MKVCLKKRGLDVRQARRMVHDRSVWQMFVKGECMGHCPGGEPLMRCYTCEMPQPFEDLEGRKSVYGQVHDLRA